MKKVEALTRQAAMSEAPVLISGESGTGKLWLARMIHQLSSRALGPFAVFNCEIFPEDLLEGELFGRVRQCVFPGINPLRAGMFELAHGGTLLLQEIGVMPLALQDKVLRALQERAVTPVYSTEPRSINVRFMTSTTTDLQRVVEQAAFRDDLLGHLQKIVIRVPSLRARRSDIPMLVRHFLKHNDSKHGRDMHLTEEAMTALLAYDWPGNVRELENLLNRLATLNVTEVLTLDDFPASVRSPLSEHM